MQRLVVEAFSLGRDSETAIEAALADRRLMRLRLTTLGGGIEAAIAHYAERPTPDMLVVESAADEIELLAELDALAAVCAAETSVILVGARNDVHLYRALKQQGLHEYLPAPLDPRLLADSLAELCASESKGKTGRLISFIGAAGGVGSSQIAHNTAFQLARLYDAETALLDLDLAFGTAALAFNQELPQHVAAILAEPERIDDSLVQRVMGRYDYNLLLLTAPPQISGPVDLEPRALDALLGAVRRNSAFVVLDLPSTWSGWVQHVLTLSDEIVVTASPRLHSLSNAKQLADLLNPRRRDAPVRMVLNRVGAHPRTELAAKDFATVLGVAPAFAFPHDPGTFEAVGNQGVMIGEKAKAPKLVDLFGKLAVAVAGRQPPRREKQGLAGLFRLKPRQRKAA